MIHSVDRACVTTPLGPITVVAEADAIVAVQWGSGRVDRAPTRLLWDAVDQLIDYFAGARCSFDLPLRLAGSDHERRVWEVMRTIPYGETLSYADVARAVGSAPRAVGRACGRNAVAVIVPCHRVIAAGGGLGGYSGGQGLATKQALLALERETAGTDLLQRLAAP